MEYQYDYLVFIGRFQPFHIGHWHVAQEALKISRNLIFVMGSHESARSTRNPFTTDERIMMIKVGMSAASGKESLVDPARLHFCPQHDHTYNDERWIASVQASVFAAIHSKWKAGPVRIGIVGYDKDHTTYYLKKFPTWELVEILPNAEHKHISATHIRQLFFSASMVIEPCFVNDTHFKTFMSAAHSHELEQLTYEWRFLEQYKQQWAASPYPPTFMTVDAVVTQSGHLLLVERKAQPGQGLWALPGGFVNQTETLEEAVLRELKEETRLAVPKPVLKGSLSCRSTFDDPHRSERGRTITEAFHFRLNDMETLPKVRGGDDAKNAFWVPFDEVVRNRCKFFEDHYAIVEKMVGI